MAFSSFFDHVTDAHLVTFTQLSAEQSWPLVIHPKGDVALFSWVAKNRDALNLILHQAGAILFRGFPLEGGQDLNQFISACGSEALPYHERSSPRTEVGSNIFTSTEYPANQPIFLHNENSYQKTWPMKLYFLCAVKPEEGGETPLASCRNLLKHIPTDLRKRLEEKGFRIVRNFSPMMGLNWTTVFGTEDRSVVDAYCKDSGIENEWKDDGSLRTVSFRPYPALKHPQTGELTWFNHGTFFHISTLQEELRAVLQACLDEEDLPTNTYYGDGTSLTPEEMDSLRAAYHKETLIFPWEKGDLLLIDNMLTAHGRQPYKGARRILVGMSDPVDREHVLRMGEIKG